MNFKKYIAGFMLVLVGIGVGVVATTLTQTVAAANSILPISFEYHGMRLEISSTDNGILIREYSEGQTEGRFIEVRPVMYGMTNPPTPIPDILVGNFDFRQPDGTGVHMLINRNKAVTITDFEDGNIVNRYAISYEDGGIRLNRVDTGRRIYIGDGMSVTQAPDFSQGSVHRAVFMHEDGSIDVVENRWSGNPEDDHEYVRVVTVAADGHVFRGQFEAIELYDENAVEEMRRQIEERNMTIPSPINQPPLAPQPLMRLVIGEELPNGMGAAVIIDDRTFVPLRYVSEMLGATVRWDSVHSAVYIYQ